MNDGPMINQPVEHGDEGYAQTSKPNRDDDPVEMPDDVIEAIPFDQMDKDGQIDHLNNVHGYWNHVEQGNWRTPEVKPGTKATKAQMSELHALLHADRNHEPELAHVHKEIEGDAQLVARAQSGLGIDAKLTATEIKRLTQVVNNDFAGVRAELQQFASDMRQAKSQEVDDNFKALRSTALNYQKQLSQIEKNATTQREAVQKQIDELEDKKRTISREKVHLKEDLIRIANEEGIEFDHREDFTLRDEKAAKSQAKGEINEMLRSAELKLERQRLTAQRVILLSGITEQGDAVLSTVPDAHKLMQSVQAESKEIEGAKP